MTWSDDLDLDNDPLAEEEAFLDPLDAPADRMPYSGASGKRSPLAPWLLVGLGVVTVVVVAVIGFNLLQRFVLRSPVNTTRAFYGHLMQKDFEGASQYVDPDSVVAVSVLGSADQLLELLGGSGLIPDDLLEGVEGVIEPEWRLIEVDFELVEREGNRARVQVAGRVRVSDARSDLGVTLPFRVTHTLRRVDGEWYVQLP